MFRAQNENFWFFLLFLGTKCPVSKVFYSRANKQMEIWSKIVYFFNAKCVPILYMLPRPILSFFIYFTTDLGNDAFELTFPIWYENRLILWNVKVYFMLIVYLWIYTKKTGFHTTGRIQLVMYQPVFYNTHLSYFCLAFSGHWQHL